MKGGRAGGKDQKSRVCNEAQRDVPSPFSLCAHQLLLQSSYVVPGELEGLFEVEVFLVEHLVVRFGFAQFAQGELLTLVILMVSYDEREESAQVPVLIRKDRQCPKLMILREEWAK